MSCPYLKEVVMLYCSGFPVRKMVPLDRIVSASPCLTQDFNHCPLYLEILTKLESCSHTAAVGTSRELPCMKEVQR